MWVDATCKMYKLSFRNLFVEFRFWILKQSWRGREGGRRRVAACAIYTNVTQQFIIFIIR